MSQPPEWPTITYEQALAAYEVGQKLHLAGRIFLVRPVRQPAGAPPGQPERPVLWVADERTTGDQGLLLFPDGRRETPPQSPPFAADGDRGEAEGPRRSPASTTDGDKGEEAS